MANDADDIKFLNNMLESISALSDAQQSTYGKQAKFHQALGEFIAQFATIETFLLDIIHRYGQLKWTVAKALLSPVRVDDGITHIRRLLFVRRLRTKRAKELAIILDHLSNINKLRNNILHMGFTPLSSPQPDEYLVTNVRFAHARRAHVRKRISTKHLEQLNWDLADMSLRLYCHLLPMPKGEPRNIALTFRRANPLGKPPTWRYKFPSPKKTRRRNRGHPPKRGDPHRSSG